MPRRPLLLCLVVALLGLASATVQGQALFGRLALTVVDPQEERLAGVKITVTTEALETYREEKTTNKRGQATLAFPDATKSYTLKLELEGYAPIETTYDPKLQRTERQTITMVPRTAAAAAAAPPAVGEEATEQRVYTAAESLFNEGVEALRSGDRDLAEARFRAALDRDPGLVAAHSALAGVLLDGGQYEAALASARAVLETRPDSSRAYRILYEAHSALGQSEEAEQALARLSELDQEGDAAALVYNEGVSALELGDVDSARERFEEALAIDPGLAPALSALAVLHINQGRYAEAAETAERLLALTPGDVKAMMIAWDAYGRMGDAERERQARERLAAANPAALAARLFEDGVALFDRNDLDAAIARFDEVLALDPSRAKAHYYLGLCHVSRGFAAEAREHLQQFVEMAPDDPDAPLASQMIESLGD